MNTAAENAKLDLELEAFQKIVGALGKVDEPDRPRILAATAALYGITRLPTTEIIHHT